MRARDLPLRFQGMPGPLNAITDVPGVEVGMVTLRDDSDVSESAVRTGVTAILPLGQAGIEHSVPAGIYSLNGNGEMTGSHWIQEIGALSGPLMITNTHAVGSVHRGVIDWFTRNRPQGADEWLLPVVAETWDGYLNAINEPSIGPEHAELAIDAATQALPAEGSYGGGTGMSCYGFKGGNGTASRLVEIGDQTYTVAVFMQCNFGERRELLINGLPMDDLGEPSQESGPPRGAGSVIAVVATDAPLSSHQCTAVARRVPLGLARTGTTGSHFSGDIFLAFSTTNPEVLDSRTPRLDGTRVETRSIQFLPWSCLDGILAATVHCVEEAVLNSLVNNESMTGRLGNYVPALPTDVIRTRLTPR